MHTVHPTRDTGYSLLPGRQFLYVIEFHLDISCLCWKLLTDGQVSKRSDVGSQYWMVPKAISKTLYLITFKHTPKSLY